MAWLSDPEGDWPGEPKPTVPRAVYQYKLVNVAHGPDVLEAHFSHMV